MPNHSSDCPYCSLALKAGELYCSKHGPEMETLKSGMFYISDRTFEECDWHRTRLSLNFNLDVSQPYYIADREYRVSPDRFLLINEGQMFKTRSDDQRSRMITLAYQIGLPSQLFQSLQKDHRQQLDNFNDTENISFFEQTFAMDEFLSSRLNTLCTYVQSPVEDDDLQCQLENILAHVMVQQHQLLTKVLSIGKTKTSTRIEIYRRLQWAVEYANHHFDRPISVEQLSEQACLSTFHFKRLFKEVYGIAPYQFIRKLRMNEAIKLLKSGMPVNLVCKAVGWEDASSFIRLFKKQVGITPAQFQLSPQYVNRAFSV